MTHPLWVRCPACQQISASIDISLSRSAEDVYECDECGHIWCRPRTVPALALKRSKTVAP
jgi:hypothetical protein